MENQEFLLPEKLPNPIDRIPLDKRPKKGECRNPKGKAKGVKSIKTILDQIGKTKAPEQFIQKIQSKFPQVKKVKDLKELGLWVVMIEYLKGKPWAVEFVADRTEGKALQRMEHQGDLIKNIIVKDEQTRINLEKLKEIN